MGFGEVEKWMRDGKDGFRPKAQLVWLQVGIIAMHRNSIKH